MWDFICFIVKNALLYIFKYKLKLKNSPEYYWRILICLELLQQKFIYKIVSYYIEFQARNRYIWKCQATMGLLLIKHSNKAVTNIAGLMIFQWKL